jgi:tyrosyl-tRNA synthetase
MDRLALIKRNTEEIVTQDELEQLLETKESPTAYVGYEPSGKIHMGHVLTVNKLIDLQNAGFHVTVLLADVHAYLNEKGTMEEVREIADFNKECFIALGLEEGKTNFVYGSDYQLEPDYMLSVLKLARDTTLNRAKRSMDEVSRNTDNPRVSQMFYPLMQAVDIALLGVDVAVGGIDQRKIHMLAREGLDGKKMSSSSNNFISMDDSEKAVKKKINKAFCPEGEIVDNSVLALFKYHIMPRFDDITIHRPDKYGGDLYYPTYEELEAEFASKELHPMDLKAGAAEYMNRILEPVREKM